MPLKLSSSISLLETIFYKTITSSKTRNSSLHLSLIISSGLSWKDHITSLSKQASKKLGVLRRLQYFFAPPQLLALYRCVARPCMEYASHIWGGSLIQLSLKRWSLGLFALSTLLLSLILYNLFLQVELFLTLSILSLLQWTLLF